MEVLKEIVKSVIMALMTEKFIKSMVIFALEKLSSKTDNKIDDEIVSKIKEALEN